MKQLFFRVFFIFIFLTFLNILSSAQTKTSFIPDLNEFTPISEIVAESNQYSDMYDPGYTVYPGFPQQGSYSVISPKTGAIYCNLDADAEMEIIFGAGETLYAVNN